MRALVSVLLIAAVMGVSVPADAREPSARSLYSRGRKLEKKGEFAAAYLLYSQAAAADPAHSEYWQRAQALQRRAITSANVMPGPDTGLAQQPPPIEISAATTEETIEARKPQAPFELEPSGGRRDFDIRADSKALWEQVTKAYGLAVVFDGDFQAGPVIKFRLTDTDYREALHALMTVTSSFFVPISSRVLLVIKDTEQKRREVENTVAVSIPIPDPVTVQEAQELGRSVQQLMEIQRFAIDTTQRLVILRDRISKVRPAQLMFSQLLSRRAEVGLEVEMMAASTASSTGWGLAIPTSFPITSMVKTIALSGGALPFALTIGNAAILATASKGESTSLYRAELRSVDGQAASLHVGEKYPIMTLNYIGQVEPGQQTYTPPPSFNFEDLGLVLKVTPKVHDSDEVTLDIEAEFKVLGAGSLNGIPVISNRKFQTRARLRFDEAAVISGLLSKNDVRTLSGPAGLLNIPVIGSALGRHNSANDNIQVLLVIKPVLLSPPPSELVTREIWVGSESRPRIPL